MLKHLQVREVTNDERETIEWLVHSRTAAVRTVERARTIEWASMIWIDELLIHERMVAKAMIETRLGIAARLNAGVDDIDRFGVRERTMRERTAQDVAGNGSLPS